MKATQHTEPPAAPRPPGEPWYWIPGKIPVRASEPFGLDVRKATEWCWEGDKKWRPIHELDIGEGGTP